MNLYIYEETTSTNDLAKSFAYHHADTIWAHHQSAGRGQRGNRWSGGVGENIAFSVVLEFQPDSESNCQSNISSGRAYLEASDQFLISQIAALSLYDVARECGVVCCVKWTNDLYAGDRKMAGILIENTLQGGCVCRSVVGIGLNVNQMIFDPTLANPTSMRAESGVLYDREMVLRLIVERLMEWYGVLCEGDDGRSRIRSRYNELLYRRDEEHTYRLPNGELIRATIEGVMEHGELLLRDEKGECRGYLFREVEFVIEGRDR